MNNKLLKILCLLLCLLPTCGMAAEFLREGELYSITEPDFREFIQHRLQYLQKTNALETLKKETIKRVRHSALRPKSLELKSIEKSYTFTVSPEFVVTKDIRLPSGQLIAAKGTTINPMHRVHFQGALIFFNGDDKAQVAWVKKHSADFPFVKLILTQGNIKKASERFGRIYFDQEGRLVQKLNIQHVPAVVTQSESRWKISIIGEEEFHNA